MALLLMKRSQNSETCEEAMTHATAAFPLRCGNREWLSGLVY